MAAFKMDYYLTYDPLTVSVIDTTSLKWSCIFCLNNLLCMLNAVDYEDLRIQAKSLRTRLIKSRATYKNRRDELISEKFLKQSR